MKILNIKNNKYFFLISIMLISTFLLSENVLAEDIDFCQKSSCHFSDYNNSLPGSYITNLKLDIIGYGDGAFGCIAVTDPTGLSPTLMNCYATATGFKQTIDLTTKGTHYTHGVIFGKTKCCTVGWHDWIVQVSH